MREIRQSGSEGGVADNGHPYPYQMRGGGSSVEGARVEVEEHAADKFDGTAVDKLIVFLVVSLLVTRFHGNLRACRRRFKTRFFAGAKLDRL